MLKRPLVPVAVVFTLGIIAVDSRCVNIREAIVLCLAGCLISFFFARQHRITVMVLLLVFLAGLARTFCFTSVSSDDISHFVARRPPLMIARVIQEPEIHGDRCSYVVRAEKILVAGEWRACMGSVWIQQHNDKGRTPQHGDHLAMRVQLSEPVGCRNPGDFSWRAYLAHKGIYAQAYVDSPGNVSRLPDSHSSVIARIADIARNAIKTSIDRLYPPLQASVMAGMTLGSYAVLPDELMQQFVETGTLHLLAASGFNCVVISAMFGLMLFLVHCPKRMRPPIIIAALLFYLLLVGVKASIVRATVMTVLGLLGLTARKPTDLINLLFSAALVILFISPLDLYDLGFQLSFTAAFGIVAVLPPINKMLRRKLLEKRPKSLGKRAGRWLRWHLIDATTATFAATLMTMPITLKAFNQLSLVSLPANMSVALASTPVLALGLISPVAVHIPGLCSLVAMCGNTASGFVISAVTFFGNMPGNCIYASSPNTSLIVAYYLLVGALFRYVSKTASES